MKRYILITLSAFALSVWADDFVCPDKVTTTYQQPATGGTINFSAKQGGTCQEYILTATPTYGYEFICWEDKSTTNPRAYIYEGGDVQFRAVFGRTEDLHSKGGDVTTEIKDEVARTYTLTTSDGQCGSTFTKWSNNETTKSITYTEFDGQVAPQFSYKDYVYRSSATDECTVLITPLECGYTLTAQPGTGYHFICWQDGDKSTNPIRDVDYEEGVYTATFTQGVAIKDGTAYSSIQAAIDDAKDKPIILLYDAEEQNLDIAKSVTMDAQGNKVGDVTIQNGGDLTLASAMKAKNLYLNSTQGASSQIHNAASLTYTNAYLDVQLEPYASTASPDKYYAFGVPFNVDVATGVARKSGEGSPLVNKSDYLIWEYDGSMRATTQKNGWKQMDNGTTLVPGKFYMIGIDGTENIWRFTKNGGELGGSTTLSVSDYPSDKGNQGWNALANSQLYYAKATIDGINYAQVYDNNSTSGKYDVVYFNDCSFVLGSPFFVQTPADKTLTLSNVVQSELHAPMRTMDNSMFCKVRLTQDGKTLDRLYLTASEEASNEYEIGKDVVKMMGGKTDSYVWANGYGYKLCAQDLPMEESLEYSITLFAAQAGEYTLSATDGKLYYQGAFVCDLSQNDYNVQLDKGSIDGYSIRMNARNTTTDIEQVLSDVNIEKFIQNNALYIRRRDKIYNAQGGIVK